MRANTSVEQDVVRQQVAGTSVCMSVPGVSGEKACPQLNQVKM